MVMEVRAWHTKVCRAEKIQCPGIGGHLERVPACPERSEVDREEVRAHLAFCPSSTLCVRVPQLPLPVVACSRDKRGGSVAQGSVCGLGGGGCGRGGKALAPAFEVGDKSVLSPKDHTIGLRGAARREAGWRNRRNWCELCEDTGQGQHEEPHRPPHVNKDSWRVLYGRRNLEKV